MADSVSMSLDEERSLWITEEQLGSVRTLKHRGRRVRFRVPKEVAGNVTLRFKGYGKSQNGTTGDLLLHVLVDRGQDVEVSLWLSERDARAGAQKNLLHHKRLVPVSIPPVSLDGQAVRVQGRGKRLRFHWGLPIFSRKRGDLLVRLRVFPDQVVPCQSPVDRMRTEDLALESWIYRRIDYILERLGTHPLLAPPFTAEEVANQFNEAGWRGLAEALVARFHLGKLPVSFKESKSLIAPGQCQKRVLIQNGAPPRVTRYTICLHSQFLTDPFAVTAILGHELCHVVEGCYLAEPEAQRSLTGAELMGTERTVDLLVFLYQLGEFQMRVARQSQVTLGYFNQEMFERMHVILSRKLKDYLRQRQSRA